MTLSMLSLADYAFNTYGEIVACWLQDIVLAGQIVHYRCAQCLPACSAWQACMGLKLAMQHGATHCAAPTMSGCHAAASLE